MTAQHSTAKDFVRKLAMTDTTMHKDFQFLESATRQVGATTRSLVPAVPSR